MSTKWYRPQQTPTRRRTVFMGALIGVPVLLLAAAGLATAGTDRLAATARGGAARELADDAVSCTIVVPPKPLSAAGLATPYRLIGPAPGTPCPERAFVQGTVVDNRGSVSVYNPLVIDDGTQPAAAPVVPNLPKNAVVGLWFGFNGDNLTLRNDRNSLRDGRCVNGLGASIFGQFAHCNAPALFTAANRGVRAGRIKVPPLGTARDGQACPSTRDFSVVDQDESDNVTTAYLVDAQGRRAQNTAANRAALGDGVQIEVNGSDNLLVDAFVDVALGCVPFTAPDLADEGAPATALALNELQAAQQKAPVALVPLIDPMTLVDGKPSLRKTNLYRAAVNQGRFDRRKESDKQYCRDLFTVQPARLELDRKLTVGAPSPDPDAAKDLFSFMALRLSGSFDDLGCGALGITNPVTLVKDGDLAVDASFAVSSAAPANPAGRATPNRLSRQIDRGRLTNQSPADAW